MNSNLTLIQPDQELLESYLTLLRESLKETDPLSLAGIDLQNQIDEISQNPDIYLAKQRISLENETWKLKLWVVLENTVIGVVSIKKQLNVSKNYEYLIGYRISPIYQGQGYGTKACKLAIDYAKEELGISDLVITCDIDNIASKRVIEKNNGVFIDTFVSEKTGKTILKYSIRTT